MDRFFKYVDANGFVRMSNVPGVDKFIKSFLKIDNTIPDDDSKALYKKPGESWSLKHGHKDYIAVEPASIFLDRVKHLFPVGWTMLSNNEDNGGKKVRKNTIIMVRGYEYVNKSISYYGHGIRIYYSDIYGESHTMAITAEEVRSLIFKPLTDSEMQLVLSFKELLCKKANPIYELMTILPEYKDDYNLYLTDCEKYGFTPLDKDTINKIPLTGAYDNTPMNFTKDCMFGWQENEDTLIVNKR